MNFTKKKILLFLLLTFTIIFLLKNILIVRFQGFYYAYKEPFDLEKVYDSNSTWVRIKLWESAIESIKEKPILGYGLGTSKKIIRKRNLEKEYTVLTIYNRSYNSHNQFLEVWIELGIVGVFVFIMFLLPMIYGLRKRNYFIFGIYIIFTANFITEAVLDRQTGIIFIVLFTCVFPFFNEDKNILIQKINV